MQITSFSFGEGPAKACLGAEAQIQPWRCKNLVMVLWSTHGTLDPLIIEELINEDDGLPRH